MNLSLKGKTALVCGASRGLGYGAAIELAKLGAEVILLARSEKRLQNNIKVLNKINKKKNRYVIADLRNAIAVRDSIKEILAKKPIHILVNNAGGPPVGKIMKADTSALTDAFNLHVVASHTITKVVLPAMKKAKYGRIINIVSTSVRQPLNNLGVSNTIRGAMASWAKTLSSEVAKAGITVNNILPGTTKTERIDELIAGKVKNQKITKKQAKAQMIAEIPMGRFAEVEEIGGVIAFLASPAASYITGTSIPVDGGKIKSI